MEITDARAEDYEDWQTYVAGQPGAATHHQAGWLTLCEEIFAVKMVPLVARRQGTICGIAPAYIGGMIGQSKSCTTLPGGILADDPQVTSALVDAMVQKAARSGARLLTVKGGPGAVAGAPHRVRPHVHSIVDLSPGLDTIWRSFPSNLRRKARKAEKVGLRFMCANQIPATFFSLFAANQHRLGTPTLPKAFFDAMNRHLAGSLVFAGIYDGESLKAGAVLIETNDRWESLYVASSRDVQRVYGVYGLYWGILQSAHEAKMSFVDYGRSVAESGNHAFKRQWNAADLWVPYWSWRLRDGQVSMSGSPLVEHQPSGAGIAQRLWPRLPAPLARHLGPIIRRQMPFG